MATHDTAFEPSTAPELLQETLDQRNITIGVPANYSDDDETRFLITPEGCGLLTSAGYKVKMEEGAGIDVSFSDANYAEYGVEICSRDEVLKADKIISFRPLRPEDIAKVREGVILLCMMDRSLFEAATIKAYLEKGVTLACFDNMISHNGDTVFADILAEIDGRSAVFYAQDALSYSGEGKGVLLAGVAGINPCEVLVIGSGFKIFTAAKAAMAVGASVTLMDNDISELLRGKAFCGDALVTCAIHPRVLTTKVKSADVIILGETTRSFTLPRSLMSVMKNNVYLLDLTKSSPSTSVPRTVAMAMSNVIVNFFNEMSLKGGFINQISSTPGVKSGVVIYRGKLVDKLVGAYTGFPSVDINMMLTGRN